MHLFIDVGAVFLDSLFKLELFSLRGQGVIGTLEACSTRTGKQRGVFFLIIDELILNTLILFTGEGEIFTFPLPLQVTFALVFIFIEGTTSADLLVYYRNWLKSVGEDDIWVHSCDINVIDEWLSLIDGAAVSDVD